MTVVVPDALAEEWRGALKLAADAGAARPGCRCGGSCARCLAAATLREVEADVVREVRAQLFPNSG